MPVSRRKFLGSTGQVLAGGALSAVCRSVSVFADGAETQPVPSKSESAAIIQIVENFRNKYDVPGLSVAFSRHGQMVYQGAFGYGDKTFGQRATPDDLFRIASVSKPITSVALFTLIEQGRLKLEDRIFGAGGVLGFDYGGTYPERVGKITVYHLLTHTGGGWENDENDPMFRNLEMNHHELIAWTLRTQPLKNEPGQSFAYSNFGYCILGRVLEKISGQSYASYVQEAVLKPCGVSDMRIGGNTLAARASGEVMYYQPNENPYGMNVARMDSHGGWMATPSDLVRFAMHVDGFRTTPSLLQPATIRTMKTPTASSTNYACGWRVNSIPNYWHMGSLPGTGAVMVQTARGLCWAGIANTEAPGLALDKLMWSIAKAVPAWNA